MGEREKNRESQRMFLALPLFEAFGKELTGFLRRLCEHIGGIRWVEPEQVHITLHFFGNITADQAVVVREVVTPIARDCPPFRLWLDHVGFFPHKKRPRVVWLAPQGDTERLVKIQQRIEKKLGEAGFPLEEREFKPHATIGRVKIQKGRADDLRFRASALHFSATEPKTVGTLVLYRSFLQPQGVRYEAVETFSLSGKAPSS